MKFVARFEGNLSAQWWVSERLKRKKKEIFLAAARSARAIGFFFFFVFFVYAYCVKTLVFLIVVINSIERFPSSKHCVKERSSQIIYLTSISRLAK